MNFKTISIYTRNLFPASMIIVAAILNGCTDDIIMDDRGNEGAMNFDVSVSAPWSEATSHKARCNREVDIDRTGDGLFLITQVSEIPDTPAETPLQTRGAQINGIDAFWTSFGLSAICTGAANYPTDDTGYGTDFIHNIRLSSSDRKNWSLPANTSLNWPGGGIVKFFAYAPFAAKEDGGDQITHSDNTHKGSPTISYTVASKIEEQQDLMYCSAECSGKGGTPVELKFKHALAAVTFQTASDFLDGEITGISISGVYGSGTSVIGSGTWTTSGELRSFTKERSITIDPEDTNDNCYAPAGGVEIIGTTGNLTLLMIPQALTENATVTMNFTDKLTGEKRTLTAKIGGTGKEWKAGKLYCYSLSTKGILIEPVYDVKVPENARLNYSGIIEDVEIAAYIEVYQKNGENKVQAKKLKANWYIESSVGGSTTIDPDDSERFIPENGSSPVESFERLKGRLKVRSQSQFLALRKPFKDKGFLTPLENNEDALDLSKPTDSETAESANCYVVNRPGYYKFPLVYGNSLDNPTAYNPGNTSTGAWTTFKDHENQLITSERIYDKYPIGKPVLIWQDSPGLITDISLDESTGHFIEFRVKEESMCQGNAVIAILGSDNKTILWSWHIYVTHYDWSKGSDVAVTSKPKGIVYHFPPANIGYCDPHAADATREVDINIVIPGPDGKKYKKSIGKFTQDEIKASSAGDNTYYQWGRKDPMLPGIYSSALPDREFLNYKISDSQYAESADKATPEKEQFDMENKPYFSPNGYEFMRGEGPVTMGEATRNPNLFFMNDHDDTGTHYKPRRHWHRALESIVGIEGKIINAWNGLITGNGDNDFNNTINDPDNILKTIYDPSPRGYMVPPVGAFSGLSNSGTSGTILTTLEGGEEVYNNNNNLLIAYKATISGKSIIFPLTGIRDMGQSLMPKSRDGSGNPIEYYPYQYIFPSDWPSTYPAFRKITFIASSTTNNKDEQTLIFYLNHRTIPKTSPETVYFCLSSNNAYGFSIRPVRIR